ncbi:hypothetical protein E2562_031310 [Oryza meyeriana var. granulata]|uniref:Uncharacterized protein n=1 Tax=Oryza meyeriana var. granulata TaxID=110450 RepID=A0A6G1CA13_9ORYZ|nr:hypothetical protein E2562_031310 [Oryza meyeriana var. granulata]
MSSETRVRGHGRSRARGKKRARGNFWRACAGRNKIATPWPIDTIKERRIGRRQLVRNLAAAAVVAASLPPAALLLALLQVSSMPAAQSPSSMKVPAPNRAAACPASVAGEYDPKIDSARKAKSKDPGYWEDLFIPL